MLIFETEILKKGDKIIIDDKEFTLSEDTYVVTAMDDDKILIKRIYKDVIFAGEAVEAIKSFYTHLKIEQPYN